MKIVVDYDKCQGTGMCESLSPDIFRVQANGDLDLTTDTVPEGQEEEVRQAVDSCPNLALRLEWERR
jgi:ferredoxin